ncbi:tRNA 2-thiouridine synthesizing protein E [gamma proteobacterium IMCC1989]|nr:tRNA 2-thiouridine synthesizing protein E [gamma proteobacterium IMCC1989]
MKKGKQHNTKQLAGKNIDVDKEGYLRHLDDWSEGVAECIAQEEGIILTQDHWAVINLLREFYHTFDVSPAMRPLVKYVGIHLGKEKANSIYLLTLFPPSPARIASKIAGLPRPANCL